MNPVFGWALAAVAVAVGWTSYGWPGVALAVSVIVFWLLMQFSRSLRVLRNAGDRPVGHVDSAVMFNARLRTGMTMLQIVALTKSLGRRVSGEPERWAWADEGGSEVVLGFDKGRCTSWVLNRPAEVAGS